MKKIINYLYLMRLNRPIGIFLLFFPCLFGIGLALKKIPDIELIEIIKITFLFFVGSTAMRSAGCVINDLIDQKYDKKIIRTKDRPIASGKVSNKEALILIFFLLAIGLAVVLQFNQKVIISSFVALFLMMIYPFTKRIIYYPQVILGLSFSFGTLMASLEILGDITLGTTILYLTSVSWIIIYDTIYAYQDIKDDLKIGIKSTAIKFNKTPKTILSIMNIIMLLGLIFTGIEENLNCYYFIIIFSSFLLLNWLIIDCKFGNPKKCLKAFNYNFWIGILITLAISLG